jgi:hypothetical protein
MTPGPVASFFKRPSVDIEIDMPDADLLFTKYCYGDQIKKDDISGARSTQGWDEKLI